MPVSCGTQLHKTKKHAEVAELADAQASGACGSNTVWVQVPSSAFFFLRGNLNRGFLIFFTILLLCTQLRMDHTPKRVSVRAAVHSVPSGTLRDAHTFLKINGAAAIIKFSA